MSLRIYNDKHTSGIRTVGTCLHTAEPQSTWITFDRLFRLDVWFARPLSLIARTLRELVGCVCFFFRFRLCIPKVFFFVLIVFTAHKLTGIALVALLKWQFLRKFQINYGSYLDANHHLQQTHTHTHTNSQRYLKRGCETRKLFQWRIKSTIKFRSIIGK